MSAKSLWRGLWVSLLVLSNLISATGVPVKHSRESIERIVVTEPIEPAGSQVNTSLDQLFGWRIKELDAGKLFCCMTDRSMRLDADSHPHIAYGESHLYYTYWDGAQWQHKIADEASGVGQQASLILDSNERPHISYYDKVNDDIKYAHWDGSQWRIQVIAADDPRNTSAIVLDSFGNPRIAYYDSVNEELIYAYWDGTQWQKEIVDSDGRIGWVDISMAVDKNNNVHIAYGKSAGPVYTLLYARRDSSWHVAVIDVGAGDPSLILDANNHPHIAYGYHTSDWSTKQLRHAEWDGAQWQSETVIDNVQVLGHPSLAFGPGDQLHVVYNGERNLRYTHKIGADWQPSIILDQDDAVAASLAMNQDGFGHLVYEIDSYPADQADGLRYNHQDASGWRAEAETIDTETYVGWDISLKLDAQGEPHISYYEREQGDLRYAFVEAGVWNRTIFQSSQDIGRYNSIAITPQGNARIAYYTRYRKGSIYVIFLNSDGSFTQKFVDGLETSEDEGTYNSIAMNDNAPCLAYYDETTGDLLYAGYAPTPYGDFVITEVDTEGDVGMYASLAFHAGDAHISYYDADNANLKFVERVGGVWQAPVVVDSAGEVGRDTSIALEADGDAHIAYNDSTNGTVKHAYQVNGVWQAPEMISAGSVPSLVLDHDGHPHVTFSGTGGLMYASRDLRGWNPPQRIYSSGEPSSLALDGQGYPQVAFLAGGNMYYASAVDASLVYLPLIVKH